MRTKRARIIAGFMCGILAAMSPLQWAAETPAAAAGQEPAGFEYADTTYKEGDENKQGYAVVKAGPEAVKDGVLTIPDEHNGKKVVALKSRFMDESGAAEVRLGKNIKDASADAFFNATSLKKITCGDNKNFTSSDAERDPALYANGKKKNVTALLDYPSAASSQNDYTVRSGATVIGSMDHARFGKLDLNDAKQIAQNALENSDISELIMGRDIQTESSGKLILPYAHVEKFTLKEGTGALETDEGGTILYDTKTRTIVKFAQGTEKADWSRFGGYTIDRFAFDSVKQFEKLSGSMPEGLMKDNTVYRFSGQSGAFVLNGQIAFCYNNGRFVPDSVAKGGDFTSQADQAHYDKVRAVMFIGVPYDATGLFKKIFGKSFDESMAETGVNGNPALNAVSAMIWHIVDGKEFPESIPGTGRLSYFTTEKMKQYMDALKEAADNPGRYDYEPKFEIEGGRLIFREQEDGTYLSDEFAVEAENNAGELAPDGYKIRMTMQGDGFGISGRQGNEFDTGERIRLTSSKKPSGNSISFSYDEMSLEYYNPEGGSDAYQNVLLSGTKPAAASIIYEIEILPPEEPEPEISTTATAGGSHEAEALGTVTVTDKVSYRNLEPGTEYTLKGTLMDKAAGKPLTAGGKQITAEKKFTPEAADGTADIEFTFDASGLKDKAAVVFEKLYKAGAEIASHEDLGDENQTVRFTRRSLTVSKQDITTKKELPGAALKITKDTKDGEIIAQWTSGNEPHVIDMPADGTYVLTETTAPAGYEVAESITFTIRNRAVQADRLTGGMIVMQDRRTPEKPPHNDPVPQIGTTATAGGLHEAAASGMVTVTDAVAFSGLGIGREYTLRGVLMDKSTGQPLLIGGKEVRAEKAFVPDAENGTVNVEFTFDASGLGGKSAVVFEKLYQTDAEIASHEDLNDGGQTVRFTDRKFRVSKQDAASSRELPGARLTITDAAGRAVEEWTSTDTPHEVEGLPDGRYTLTEVTAPYGYSTAESIEFTIENGAVAGGTVTMLDSKLPTKPNGGGPSIGHTPQAPQNPSPAVPGIATTATVNGTHSIEASGMVTVTDEVRYWNLVPGKNYKIEGVLMDKATGKTLMADGREVTASASFIPDRTDGSTAVRFTFDMSGFDAVDAVAFENLYCDGVPVASHADITDLSQTVVISNPAKGRATAGYRPGGGEGLPSTRDIPASELTFWAAAIVLACIIAGRKKRRAA